MRIWVFFFLSFFFKSEDGLAWFPFIFPGRLLQIQEDMFVLLRYSIYSYCLLVAAALLCLLIALINNSTISFSPFFLKWIICPVHLALKIILGKSSGSARLLLKLLASQSCGNNPELWSFFIYHVLVYLCVCFNSFSFSIAVEMSLHYKCF